jgi:hypothetical protein
MNMMRTQYDSFSPRHFFTLHYIALHSTDPKLVKMTIGYYGNSGLQQFNVDFEPS